MSEPSSRSRPAPPRGARARGTSGDGVLEVAIGRQVRHYRTKLGMTVAELARQAELSQGMLSKIENGLTSPSLGTLSALSAALNVPVTALFRRFEQQRDVTRVGAGEGLKIERSGSRAGHQYELLGHTVGKGKPFSVEPFLITISDSTDVFPLFEHAGVEFIYLLAGRMMYRHGGQVFELGPGDSLFFDASAAHGPEELLELPVRLLSVITEPHGED